MSFIQTDRRVNVDREFVFLTLFLIAVNLPFFLKLVIPIHDTGHLFRIFYFFYNDVFYNSQIPQWLPFGFYGLQSSLLFSLVSPACFVTGIIGLVFRVQDVLFLFTLALLIEQFIMVWGMYRLARLLFNRNGTVLFVCLSMICGNVFITQLGLNFRMFYLLPLVIYYVLRFFIEKRPSMLAIALIVSLLWFQGVAAYVIAMPALTVSCIFLALAVAYRNEWRGFLSISRREASLSIGLFTIFVSVLAIYYSYLKGTMFNAELLSPGRNPDYSVTLQMFLTYGGRTGFEKFLGMLYPAELGSGQFHAFESTTYYGLIPFLFTLYAMFTERGRVFFALMFAVVMLGILSLGETTFVAEWLYSWFPMMKYYRHIGFAVSIYKILLPVVAGFGVERLISKPDVLTAMPRRTMLFMLIALVAAEHGIVFYLLRLGSPMAGVTFFTLTAGVVYAALAAGYFAFMKNERAGIVFFLILCVMLETVIYQSAIGYRVRLLANEVSSQTNYTISRMISTMKTNKYAYSEMRPNNPVDERGQIALAYSIAGSPYNYNYDFIQTDPCRPILRADVLGANIMNLIRTRKQNTEYMVDDLSAIGCTSPKLRVVADVEYADTYEDLTAKIEESPTIGSRPIIYGVPVGSRTPGAGKAGTAEMVRYTPNEITISATTNDPAGAWLYYADSWHENWKAYVNGSPQPVYIANMAFKAIRLYEGESTVVMRFENWRERTMQYILIAFGVGVILLLLTCAMRTALRGQGHGEW